MNGTVSETYFSSPIASAMVASSVPWLVSAMHTLGLHGLVSLLQFVESRLMVETATPVLFEISRQILPER